MCFRVVDLDGEDLRVDKDFFRQCQLHSREDILRVGCEKSAAGLARKLTLSVGEKHRKTVLCREPCKGRSGGSRAGHSYIEITHGFYSLKSLFVIFINYIILSAKSKAFT